MKPEKQAALSASVVSHAVEKPFNPSCLHQPQAWRAALTLLSQHVCIYFFHSFLTHSSWHSSLISFFTFLCFFFPPIPNFPLQFQSSFFLSSSRLYISISVLCFFSHFLSLVFSHWLTPFLSITHSSVLCSFWHLCVCVCVHLSEEQLGHSKHHFCTYLSYFVNKKQVYTPSVWVTWDQPGDSIISRL